MIPQLTTISCRSPFDKFRKLLNMFLVSISITIYAPNEIMQKMSDYLGNNMNAIFRISHLSLEYKRPLMKYTNTIFRLRPWSVDSVRPRPWPHGRENRAHDPNWGHVTSVENQGLGWMSGTDGLMSWISSLDNEICFTVSTSVIKCRRTAGHRPVLDGDVSESGLYVHDRCTWYPLRTYILLHCKLDCQSFPWKGGLFPPFPFPSSTVVEQLSRRQLLTLMSWYRICVSVV